MLYIDLWQWGIKHGNKLTKKHLPALFRLESGAKGLDIHLIVVGQPWYWRAAPIGSRHNEGRVSKKQEKNAYIIYVKQCLYGRVLDIDEQVDC